MPPMHPETLLICNGCGVSKTFVAAVSIKLMSNGATTPTPAGHLCAQCHAPVDIATMVKHEERRRKKAEWLALHQEITAEQEPVAVEKK